MKMRFIIYGVLLAVVGLGVVMLGRMNSAPVSAQAAVKTQYLAVTRPLEAGSFLETNDLEWRDWSGNIDTETLSRCFAKDSKMNPDALVGVVLRKTLKEGDFLSSKDFFAPGESAFLAAVLKPGTRAVAIPVNDVTGGAGLIRPGNRVDVILSGKLEQNPLGLADAQTMLRDIRVIAVNRDTGTPAAAPGKGGTSQIPETPRQAAAANKGTVTLEVSPKEVELLTVAKGVGTLSLSLRSLHDPEELTFNDQDLTRASELVRREPAPSARAPRQVITLYGSGEAH